MAFFTSAIDTLKVLVIALGAGLGVYPQSCWLRFFNASFSSSGAAIEQYAHARFLFSISRSPFLSGIRLPEGL